MRTASSARAPASATSARRTAMPTTRLNVGSSRGRHLGAQQQRAIQSAFRAGPRTTLPAVTETWRSARTTRPSGSPASNARLIRRSSMQLPRAERCETGSRSANRLPPRCRIQIPKHAHRLSGATKSRRRKTRHRAPLAHSRTLFPTVTPSTLTGTSLASTWPGSSSNRGCTTKSRSSRRGCGNVSTSASTTYSW